MVKQAKARVDITRAQYLLRAEQLPIAIKQFRTLFIGAGYSVKTKGAPDEVPAQNFMREKALQSNRHNALLLSRTRRRLSFRQLVRRRKTLSTQNFPQASYVERAFSNYDLLRTRRG